MKNKLFPRYPLGNPRRLWRQDNFIFSTFSPGYMGLEEESDEADAVMRRAVKTCVDAGFNLLELGWASPRRGLAAVQESEKWGIGVIYQNLKQYGGMGKNKIFCETNDLLGAMEAMRPWKSVVGYYLWDEPHSLEQMHLTRRMMDFCQATLPETLPFTVALPSYSKTCLWEGGGYPEYIQNYADIIDPPIMSFDHYPVGKTIRFAGDGRNGRDDAEVQLDESFLWCDLECFRRVAAEKNIPFWFYYQGQNLHYVEHFTFPMVRLMMHGALLYGVKGLQDYAAWESVVDPATGGHGVFFEEQKQIHAQLREWGNTLMALSCRRVIHDAALLPDCPYMEGLRHTMEESELLAGTLPYRTSVSELSDEYGNQYLMVLNRDYETEKEITLTLKAPSRLYEVSREDGFQRLLEENTGTLRVRLVPGDAALYRVQPVEEEPCLVEYYLEKQPRQGF